MVDLEKTYLINRNSYVTELKKEFVKLISQIKTLKGVNFSYVLNQNPEQVGMTLKAYLVPGNLDPLVV